MTKKLSTVDSLTRNIIKAFKEYEKEMMSERIRRALALKKIKRGGGA